MYFYGTVLCHLLLFLFVDCAYNLLFCHVFLLISQSIMADGFLRVYIIIQSTSCFVLLTHFYSLINVSGGLVALYQFNSSYLCYITKYFCQHWLRRETKLYTSALIPAVIALLNAGSTRQCTLCMHCAFWVSGWVYRCRRNLPWSYLSFFFSSLFFIYLLTCFWI